VVADHESTTVAVPSVSACVAVPIRASVSVRDVAVAAPMFGVINVGVLANTRAPVPVSSVTAANKFADDGVPRNVAIPVPKDVIPVPPFATGRVPVTPVVSGSPVTFVITPDAGVPRAGVVSVGLVNVLFVSVSETSLSDVPLILKSFPEARFTCSENVQASVASTQLIVLSVAPLRVIPPPSAPASVGVATDPRTRFLSSIVISVELIVVVVPLTVRSPESVRLVPDTAPVNVAPDSDALASICV